MAPKQSNAHQLLIPWVYDVGLWMFTLCLDVFFREIYPRGAWRVPKHDPVIIVAAPHANQFVDSLVLMRILKAHASRRVSFLIAEKSMKEPFIGTMAGYMGALPVARAMDDVKDGKGVIFLPDPVHDPTLIHGSGTDFTDVTRFMVGGSITLPKIGKESPETLSIAEINGPEELRLKKPVKASEAVRQLTTEVVQSDKTVSRGTVFKVSPHIDQSKLFDTVFRELSSNGCIGIFPEGGSHDRSNLLPLKAGAAIMALGTLARDPDCRLSIIPCGMNYFHAHKFRSRAVIEFGPPIEVQPEQVEAYKAGGIDRRNAVSSLLETIYEGLAAVTQLSPDHETLMLVQATRRLYNPINKKLPLSIVIEFNRRLLKGYTQCQNDPRVIKLKKAVMDYNRRLRALGIKDHQVEWGNVQRRPWWLTLGTFLYFIGELLIMSIGILPGLVLFWPVFIITKVISAKKRQRALAASVVKLRGHDVVSTWKIIVAIVLAPSLYIYYTVIVTTWLYYNRNDGYYSSSVPWWMTARAYISDTVPLWLFSVSFFALMIALTFTALRVGESGMDIIKALPPILVALNPRPSDSLVKLRVHRQALATQVIDVINTLGPTVFPDFDADQIADDTFRRDAYQSRLKSMPPSEPESRSRSRSRSRRSSWGSGLLASQVPIKPLSSIDSRAALSEMNRRIRDSMQERGRDRVRTQWGEENSQEMATAEAMMQGGHWMERETEARKKK